MAGTRRLDKSPVPAAMIAVALAMGACGGPTASDPGRGIADSVRATRIAPEGGSATASSGPVFRSRALTATPDARAEEGVITRADGAGFDFAYAPRTWRDVDMLVTLTGDARVARERGGRLVRAQPEDLTRGQRVEVWFLNVFASYPGQGESDLVVIKDEPLLKLNPR